MRTMTSRLAVVVATVTTSFVLAVPAVASIPDHRGAGPTHATTPSGTVPDQPGTGSGPAEAR